MTGAEEKTEPATPERQQRARREGQTAKSRDLVGAAGLAAGAAGLATASDDIVRSSRDAMVEALSNGTFSAPGELLHEGLVQLGRALGPITAAVMGGVVLASVLQVGLLLAPKAIGPRPERIDPTRGLQRLFSRDTAVELAKNVVKLVVAAGLALGLAQAQLPVLARLGRLPLDAGATIAFEILGAHSVRLVISFAVIGGLDALWSRWSFARRLRMSRREVRREQRDREGDPQQRAHRQQLARELLLNGRIEDVPSAKVVVVNPVQVAVALAYDDGDAAPRVLVKGRGARARRVRSAAERARVPIVPDRPLARALHEVVVGDEIPEELWEAVADVLLLALAADVTPGAD